MGGIYNWVNLHAYHYAGNNPVRYTDPDGRHDETVILFRWYKNVKTGDNKFSFYYSGSYDAEDKHGNTSTGYFTSDTLPEGITIDLGILGGTTLIHNEDLATIAEKTGATIIPKHSTRLLRANLGRQGERQPGWGFHAHHIVPGQDKRAQAVYARSILLKYGIDPNHAENGVWLSPTEHGKTYSSDYLDRLERLLRDADATGTREAVLKQLDHIKTSLKNGNHDF
jgi:hypothetical protein